MQRTAVVIEGEVQRAIAGADADRDGVVRVALAVGVVAEFERGPSAARQLTASQDHVPRGVPEGRVLIIPVADDAVLLKGLAVQVAAVGDDGHAGFGEQSLGLLAEAEPRPPPPVPATGATPALAPAPAEALTPPAPG